MNTIATSVKFSSCILEAIESTPGKLTTVSSFKSDLIVSLMNRVTCSILSYFGNMIITFKIRCKPISLL